VETPGGWQDFIGQNPGFFGPPPVVVPAKPAAAKKPDPPASKTGKLSYKDQRRLTELETLIAEAPARITALEAALADPGLYARDPAAFARASQALEAARAELFAGEEEWLELEERREALASGA